MFDVGMTGVSRGRVDDSQAHAQRGHAAKTSDRDPREDDDHRHLEGELKQIGDQDSPQSAKECVEAGEGNQDEDADEERGVARFAKGVVQQRMATQRKREHATLQR